MCTFPAHFVFARIVNNDQGLVFGGGFKTLANFAQAVVPFMAVAYTLLGLYVLLANVTQIPEMLSMVFKSAFNFSALGGGMLGYTVQQAFRFGMARGIFSNEAGQGSVVNISSSASARHPVTQGFLGMFGVATDTLVVCSATGMIILMSGVDYTTITGAALTQMAFGTFFGHAPWIIAITLVFFAFTSLLASIYGGQVNIKYLFGNNSNALRIYFGIQLVLVAAAAMLSTSEMFLIIDCLSGFMCLCNMVALIFLYRKAKDCLTDYEEKKAQGDNDPIYDWNKFRAENGMKPFSE